LSHLPLLSGYDEPTTLSYQITLLGPISADVRHNKFDDIFLLTGGNAGTRTLTVNVYEQAFAISNIGAGAAVAVVIFGCLLTFSLFFLKYISREEGL
jgi:ABC-type sugar transport system permease subunit